MRKRLYGHVASENTEFEWKAERGACEKCQEMDGTIYVSGNDIPDRPHPNCKCWIDVLEVVTDAEPVDPIERRRARAKDVELRKLELMKLLGDTNSIAEEIDAYANRVEEQEVEVKKVENAVDTTKLGPKERAKIAEVKEKVDYAKYKGEKAKREVEVLEKKVERVVDTQDPNSILNGLDKLYYDVQYAIAYVETLTQEFRRLQDQIIKMRDDLAVKYATKEGALVYGQVHSLANKMPESYNLFKIAVNEDNYNVEYIKKNGTLYNSIDDLNNDKLAKEIRQRIKQETNNKDCKVLVLNSNSSIAQEIQNSDALGRFIQENMREIQKNGKVSDKTIEFNNTDKDLYSTFHGAVVKNISLDSDGNLNIRIEDFYNFNSDRTSVKGRLGEKLQKQGDIEPYYVITVLKIPNYVWKSYKVY